MLITFLFLCIGIEQFLRGTPDDVVRSLAGCHGYCEPWRSKLSPQRSADQLKHSETMEEVAGLPDEDKMPGQKDRVERKSESLLDSNSNTHKAHSL